MLLGSPPSKDFKGAVAPNPLGSSMPDDFRGKYFCLLLIFNYSYAISQRNYDPAQRIQICTLLVAPTI